MIQAAVMSAFEETIKFEAIFDFFHNLISCHSSKQEGNVPIAQRATMAATETVSEVQIASEAQHF